MRDFREKWDSIMEYVTAEKERKRAVAAAKEAVFEAALIWSRIKLALLAERNDYLTNLRWDLVGRNKSADAILLSAIEQYETVVEAASKGKDVEG